MHRSRRHQGTTVCLKPLSIPLDHPHSEDEQDEADIRKDFNDDVRSNKDEELKSSRIKLLDQENKHPTKRPLTNLLEVPRNTKKDVVSATSTKKATVDDNESGKEETIEQRVKELRAIHDAKSREHIEDKEEEKKLSTINKDPQARKFWYLSPNVILMNFIYQTFRYSRI